MRKVIWSTFFFLFVFSVSGQKFYNQPLLNILTAVSKNKYFVVEGYYVDNSSFIVIRSSTGTIDENKRYPVYEFKQQEMLHSTSSAKEVEMSVLVKREMQGEKSPRILFLIKPQTSISQLVVEDSAMLGMPIEGDLATFTQLPEGRVFTGSLSELREFFFNKGAMPSLNIKE